MVEISLSQKVVTPSVDVLLAVCAASFYAFDSALLLYANEIVFVKNGPIWGFSRGSNWEVLRKNPYLPNPLTPSAALFHATWSPSGSGQTEEDFAALDRFLVALIPLQYATLLQLALMLCGLVLVAFMHSPVLPCLLLIAIFYASTIAMLVYTFHVREHFGLSTKAIGSIAFECLACAPAAINLVRKISLRHSLAGDAIEVARALFDKQVFTRLVTELYKRTQELLDQEEVGGRRHEQLSSYHARLAEMLQ